MKSQEKKLGSKARNNNSSFSERRAMASLNENCASHSFELTTSEMTSNPYPTKVCEKGCFFMKV